MRETDDRYDVNLWFWGGSIHAERFHADGSFFTLIVHFVDGRPGGRSDPLALHPGRTSGLAFQETSETKKQTERVRREGQKSIQKSREGHSPLSRMTHLNHKLLIRWLVFAIYRGFPLKAISEFVDEILVRYESDSAKFANVDLFAIAGNRTYSNRNNAIRLEPPHFWIPPICFNR